MHSKERDYPSEITREQFKLVSNELESARKKTKPRTVDLYDVFCAIRYVLKGGIQWRMLPSDFPKWRTVYYYYRIWTEIDENGVSVFERLLQKIVCSLRLREQKEPSPSMGIIDSKSIQNSDTAREKGYDGGKKVSGIKVHIMTDTLGLPHMVHVTTANISDREGAIEMLSRNVNSLAKIKKILVDKGYSGDDFETSVNEICDISVEVSQQKKLHYFKPEPFRWVVERAFAWVVKARRLARNYEKTCEATRQMAIFAYLSLFIQRFQE